MWERAAENLSDDQMDNIIAGLQESDLDVNRYLGEGIEQRVVPHLEDVRDRAQGATARDVRQRLADLDDSQQDEFFYDAVSDVFSAAAMLRERPTEGALLLKGLLRDPFTVESLLLIFDHEDIPDHLAAQQKAFAATHIRWLGSALVPEAYTDEELAAIRGEFDAAANADG